MTSAQAQERTRTGTSIDAFRRALLDNLYYTQGKDRELATRTDYYAALAYTVRDRMLQRWLRSGHAYRAAGAKVVYFLSAEYLLGRQLANNLLNEGLTDVTVGALAELGLELRELIELEEEPGLGNGGLGRLAACFMDSLATLSTPAVGHGIRYEYGIFRQSFRDGWQIEQPDDWLRHGNPWEFAHTESAVPVGFGGYTIHDADERGVGRVRWVPDRTVLGVPYNTMVPGYATDNVNTLRLWSARASESFDLQVFNAGDYARAVERQTFSEIISKVLYPDDTTLQGQQLRLQQQYFFVACALADILRDHLAAGRALRDLPERAVIQLNDTHPSVAVAELMRLLMDGHRLGWDEAWAITTHMFGYTVHTLMPEALEEWPVGLFGALLPRHLEIIFEINRRFLADVRLRFPGDEALVARVSLIREQPERRVRMANLAVVAAFSVNGVAQLHSDLLRERTLRDLAAIYPAKFGNKTNGVTPRRFIQLANPGLAALVTSTIGGGWLTDLERLRELEPHADDPAFRAAWRAAKHANKRALAGLMRERCGVPADPAAMFDIMVKRLHEYKRQLLKLLHIVTAYQRLKSGAAEPAVPRTFVFGAKAAPGYRMAKLIIRLINGVAEVVNNDPQARGWLSVAFLPNFNVSSAEWIYPGADLSEQISLAGKEASGTGNMKFALNGAVTVGTLDGANVEIRDAVGQENFFLFGLTAPQVFALKDAGYRPIGYYERDDDLRWAIDAIGSGVFSRGDAGLFRPIVDSLLHEDAFMLLADYRPYLAVQELIDQAYLDEERWLRMSILNTARSGFFSSDRTIREYCRDIWRVAPVTLNQGQ